MSNIECGIIWVGPVKVEIEVNFIGGLLCLTDRKGRLNPMGYPNLVLGRAFISYSIGGLSPILQSAFRDKCKLKKWTALMYVLGEVWEGPITYDWALNTVSCELERLSD